MLDNETSSPLTKFVSRHHLNSRGKAPPLLFCVDSRGISQIRDYFASFLFGLTLSQLCEQPPFCLESRSGSATSSSIWRRANPPAGKIACNSGAFRLICSRTAIFAFYLVYKLSTRRKLKKQKNRILQKNFDFSLTLESSSQFSRGHY